MGVCESKPEDKHQSLDSRSVSLTPASKRLSYTGKRLSKRLSSIQFDLVQEIHAEITKHYTFKQEIGSGSFGKVSKAIHKQSGLERAIKVLSKKHMSEKQQDCLLNEVRILKQLDHPSIVKIYEFYQNKDYFYIVTEILSGGELFDKISNEVFDEKRAAIIMKQIVSATQYLHSKNIMHRDLKPENMMLKYKDDLETIKIIDFGTAISFEKDQYFTQRLGTPYYIAPEVINKYYNYKCDVWACGVIFYVLLEGFPPFNGRNEQSILQKISKGVFTFFNTKISVEAKYLISSMLTFSLTNRFSCEDILNSAWILKNAPFTNKINKSSLANIYKNMESAKFTNNIQKAFYKFIIHQMMTDRDRDILEKIFLYLDKNGDGVISVEELTDGFKLIQPLQDQTRSRNRSEVIVNIFDENQNKQLEFSEFMLAGIDRSVYLTDDKMKIGFEMIDIDHSGECDVNELKEKLGQNIPLEKWMQLVKDVDENEDGKINYNEFSKVLKSIISVQKST